MRPIVTDRIALSVIRSVCHSSEPCKNEKNEMPFGLRTWVGRRKHVLDAVQITHGKGQFWGGNGSPLYRDAMLWGVQKQLNPSRCRLGCGLQWAQWNVLCGSVHWRNLMNTTEPSCAAAMRPVVKLLWPLVCCCTKILLSTSDKTREPILSCLIHRMLIPG